MPRTKGRKSAERRALHLDRPAHRVAASDLVGDPFAQELFELRLEIVRRRIGIERGLEMPALGQEPFLEEGLERQPILRDAPAIGILHRHGGRLPREAKDEDIGQRRALLALLDRGEDLVGGTARIRPAARERLAEIRRQLRAQPPLQDADHHVAIGRARDLRLEGRIRAISLGLPAHHLEPRHARELAIEPARDILRALALDHHIAGRRHEQPEDLHAPGCPSAAVIRNILSATNLSGHTTLRV